GNLSSHAEFAEYAEGRLESADPGLRREVSAAPQNHKQPSAAPRLCVSCSSPRSLRTPPPRTPRTPRSMRAIVKGRAPPGRTPSLFSFGDQPRSLIGPRAFRGRGLGVLLARRRSLLPHRSSLVRASGSRGPTASADRILKANHGSIRDSALSRP